MDNLSYNTKPTRAKPCRFSSVKKELTVLSLFDGIACGLLALKKSGLKVARYFASEIAPNAICVATKNNPEIIELGDITQLYYKNGCLYTPTATYNVGHIDLICGGSPCTNFSSIGYANGMLSGKEEIISLSQYLSLKSKDVSHCLTVKRSFPRLIAKYGYIPEKFNAYNASEIKTKACALSRGSMVTSSCATLLFVAVKNGCHIVNNGVLNGEYKTLLPDGKYNIRKLNLTEIERLQNLPDGYTDVDSMSDQQRISLIGNGWTIDVLAYIFSYIKGCSSDN